MWFCMFTMRLSRLLLCLVVTGILLIGIAWLDNNWSIRPPSRADFLGRMDNAIRASRDWVLAMGDPTVFLMNEESAALLQNAILMHMVADCARASSDERLKQLAALYFSVNAADPYSMGRLVDRNRRFKWPAHHEWSAEDYQPWYIHAVAPTEYPLSAEAHANMFSPDKYRTGGATHQLFALYLYRNYNGATPDLNHLIRHISVRIASEASIDFRVTDLYLQRIAFLLATGQIDLVRRRWVERALAAQRSDGGWLVSWHGWQPSPFSFRFEEDFHEPCNCARHVDGLHAEVSLPAMDREKLPVIRTAVFPERLRPACSNHPRLTPARLPISKLCTCLDGPANPDFIRRV